ncbi:MAG: hypothetical protein H0U42_05960 [Thermoleophilaceae bacterium]|nr:hypothetical protein [Thermoleophilaceae bacterium]
MHRVKLTLAAGVVVLLISAPAAAAAPVSAERTAPQREVLEYWTPERMAEAGAPVLEQTATGPEVSIATHKKATRRAKRSSYTSKAVPSATATSSAYAPIGKIFGRIPGEGDFQCSGSVVQSPNQRVVLTAAHCLIARGQFADRLLFIPASRNGEEPLGRWVSDELFVPGGYPTTENPKLDYGAAVIALQEGRTVQSVAGFRKVRTSTRSRQTFRALGYPGNKARGQRLWGCRSKLQLELSLPGGHDPFGIGCDMTFGASGGPWIGSSGDIVSVTSLGVDGFKNFIFGPQLRAGAKRLLRDAGER